MNKLFCWYKEKNRFVLNILGIKFKFKNLVFNANTFSIKGKNNYVYFIDDNTQTQSKFNENIEGLKVVINGNNNNIAIAKNNLYRNCTIFINGNDTNIQIEESKFFIGVKIWSIGNNNVVKISNNTSIESCDIHAIEDCSQVYIGNNCALSRNIKIYPTDGHAIIDINNERIINFPQIIQIEDNCWIGDTSIILKGVNLKKNTIVGAGSIVTKAFQESNIIIAGNPAQIIKRGVKWDRETASNKAKFNKTAAFIKEKK